MSLRTFVLCCALLGGLPIVAISLIGCTRGGVAESPQGPTTEQLISYYSPRSVKILPFTKPRDFDNDGLPDGIGVSLRPLDGSGDPVKAYGVFVFELYGYRPASGDHRGELLQTWQQPVTSPNDQKQFWERVTSTYEFQLSWEGQPVPPQKKYILTVSFQSPGSERLFDEYEFEFRVPREEMRPTGEGHSAPKK